MKQLKVRCSQPADAAILREWLESTQNNLFDNDILHYPTLEVACSYDESGPAAYLPWQQVLMLESLAVRPGLAPIQAAQSFRDLVKATEFVASVKGIREVYFVCKDQDVVKVAKGHGFDVLGEWDGERFVPWTVVRVKL